MDLSFLQQLYLELSRIDGYLYTIVHPNLVLAKILDDSIGLLLNVWYRFILSTTDLESGGGDFINNRTIQAFEPKVQVVSDAALALVALWAAYRIMWGHGLFTQYTARILLPRLFMAVVLINFALPMIQMCIGASNVLSIAAHNLNAQYDLGSFAASFVASYDHDPNAGTWELITTAALAAGFGVLAVSYVLRYAILIVLAITAPIAALLFMLPETNHVSKMWMSHFTTNLLMQPAQLFVLSIGFGLERDGITPIHHLFALASLLIVLKVPGAMGGGEKAGHKLQSILHEGFKHLGHALAKA